MRDVAEVGAVVCVGFQTDYICPGLCWNIFPHPHPHPTLEYHPSVELLQMGIVAPL